MLQIIRRKYDLTSHCSSIISKSRMDQLYDIFRETGRCCNWKNRIDSKVTPSLSALGAPIIREGWLRVIATYELGLKLGNIVELM